MNTKTIELTPELCVDRPESSAAALWLRRTLDSLRRHRQRRLAIRELSRMSDWRLQDMGIPRGRIADVVDGLIAREGPECRR